MLSRAFYKGLGELRRISFDRRQLRLLGVEEAALPGFGQRLKSYFAPPGSAGLSDSGDNVRIGVPKKPTFTQ